MGDSRYGRRNPCSPIEGENLGFVTLWRYPIGSINTKFIDIDNPCIIVTRPVIDDHKTAYQKLLRMTYNRMANRAP